MSKPISLLALITATLFCTFVVPWYLMIPLAVLIGYYSNAQKSFLVSFFLVPFSMWIGMCIIQDMEHSVKVADMISQIAGQVHVGYIYIMTGLLMGLVSLFAGMSGNYFKDFVVNRK